MSMLEKLSWHCIGHNPTTWGLGVLEGKELNNLHAKVYKREDGTWAWSLVAGALSPYGVEPSRELAIKAASEANIDRYKHLLD